MFQTLVRKRPSLKISSRLSDRKFCQSPLVELLLQRLGKTICQHFGVGVIWAQLLEILAWSINIKIEGKGGFRCQDSF